MPSYSGVWDLTAVYQAVGSGNWPSPPPKSLFAGGYSPNSNVIDSILLASTGNAVYFGDLASTVSGVAGCASTSRAVFGGGDYPYTAAMTYVSFATIGNSVSFGNLTVARYGLAGCNSTTRGVFGGGTDSGAERQTRVDYITIASTGNATVFGSLTQARYRLTSCSSSTRGVFYGGDKGGDPSLTNVIDYITIATTGNATDFGDIAGTFGGYGANNTSGASSSTRGVFANGSEGSGDVNVITYITIATTGNSTDFGDLTVTRGNSAAVSNTTLCAFGGGGSNQNVIDYVTIATTGNATDFGDLTVGRSHLAGASPTNGGVQ